MPPTETWRLSLPAWTMPLSGGVADDDDAVDDVVDDTVDDTVSVTAGIVIVVPPEMVDEGVEIAT